MSVTPAVDIARCAAAAADAKKATDIVALDLGGLSDVTDAIVVCTAPNARLASSVIDEAEERVRLECGLTPLSVTGANSGPWMLLDYGCVTVHVFSPEGRDYYRIERLWGDAKAIDLDLLD